MATFNIDSLPKHFDEINLIMLRDKKIDILALNENRHRLVSVNGYDLIRAHRNRNRGGVCINYLKRLDLVP